MKRTLIAAAIAIACTYAFSAAPPKPKAEGIYNADSIISMAPPRSTHVLVEQDGSLWAASFFIAGNDRGFFAQLNEAYAGQINKNGKGKADNLLTTGLSKVPVEADITENSIHLVFNNYVRVPMSKQASFDPVLKAQGDLKGKVPVVRALYAENTFYGTFNMTVAEKGKFTGSNGNCMFEGRLDDSGADYKRVTLTYKNACWAADNVTHIKQGDKMGGVFFPSTHYEGFNQVGPKPIWVLVMQTSEGKNKIALTKAFAR